MQLMLILNMIWQHLSAEAKYGDRKMYDDGVSSSRRICLCLGSRYCSCWRSHLFFGVLLVGGQCDGRWTSIVSSSLFIMRYTCAFQNLSFRRMVEWLGKGIAGARRAKEACLQSSQCQSSWAWWGDCRAPSHQTTGI
jgi:hypothetical protein